MSCAGMAAAGLLGNQSFSSLQAAVAACSMGCLSEVPAMYLSSNSQLDPTAEPADRTDLPLPCGCGLVQR